MVYVMRDENNKIISSFDKNQDKKLENLPSNNNKVIAFLGQFELEIQSNFLKADIELIRVIKDQENT